MSNSSYYFDFHRKSRLWQNLTILSCHVVRSFINRRESVPMVWRKYPHLSGFPQENIPIFWGFHRKLGICHDLSSPLSTNGGRREFYNNVSCYSDTSLACIIDI